MSRPPAAAQPNSTVAAQFNQPLNAAPPTPRPNPAPFAVAGPFQPLGVPRPAPFPAPFYHTWRPPVFPPVLPPGAFRGPRVYQPPPPPSGGFRPHPGTPFNPFGLLGFRPSHTYPPVSVLSHQRPAVIDGSFSPGAMTRPPITPVPPADVFGPGAVTRPQPLIELVPPANVFGPRAVTRPLTTPAPPANVFGPGAVTRPPIASVPPTNVFDPGAMARPPITHIPPANVFGPGAVTRPSIALISLANVFGSGAMARPPITHVPPSNVFGFGAMARPPITPVPPANVFGPGTVARPPITHLPPANVFGFGAMTRPPITPVPPANVFGPGAVTRPSIAPVPPANVFGHGAMTRRPITPVPPVTDFGPEAVTRSPIAPVPSATDFGPEAVTRSPITPVPPATDFGPEAVTRSPIAPVPPANEPQFKVYVGKIASTVENDFVLSLLQICGHVKSWNPVTNPIDGTCTGFGFCDFESAEGCLRAWRLLNKLSIDGQELLLNVNEATREHLQKYGQNSTEEKANEADEDAMQTIHGMVEERMRSKLPGSPIPPVQVSASIADEIGNGDTRSDAPEQRKIRRQRENEEHLRDSKVVCLQGWKDREVTSPGKFSLQIDAISSMYVPMECESAVEHERKRQHRESDCISSMHVPIERESTVEHERKRQHRERDVFHKRNGEGKDIVSVSGLVSDKLNSSTPGKRVSFELQATSKSGNKETLDEEQLLAAVPKTKEELFAYDVNWAIYDKHGLHERMRPWVSEKSTEVFGEEIAEFVEYVVASTKEHVDAPRIMKTKGMPQCQFLVAQDRWVISKQSAQFLLVA
ncbi:hypothetical protein ZWY2020_039078 [Hordeum vulgare]|nr:hypothetical protein ZWY2020_039078 [Hordeum vulgare]